MLLQILNSDLCLLDQDNKTILKIHKPLFTTIKDFKIVKNNIVIQEETTWDKQSKSNIYCLDNEFNLIWFSELPFENDNYPNPIIWDNEFNSKSRMWDYIPNPNVFTSSSVEGITVSINYETGKIEKSVFTK